MEQTNEKQSFETKIVEAQKLLETLIDPEITLSKSVEVYKSGMEKLEEAQKLLDEAKLEFEEISN
jgi:exodeoxyribonuclease VII small subunit